MYREWIHGLSPNQFWNGHGHGYGSMGQYKRFAVCNKTFQLSLTLSHVLLPFSLNKHSAIGEEKEWRPELLRCGGWPERRRTGVIFLNFSKTFYTETLLFFSSIHISNYFSKKGDDAAQIYTQSFGKKRFTGREEHERIHYFSPLCCRTLKLRFELASAPLHVFPCWFRFGSWHNGLFSFFTLAFCFLSLVCSIPIYSLFLLFASASLSFH